MGKKFLHWLGSELGQIQTALQAGSSREPQVGHIITVLWERGSEGAPAPLCPLRWPLAVVAAVGFGFSRLP